MTSARFKRLKLQQLRLSEFVRQECASYVGNACTWTGAACPLVRLGGRETCAQFECALLDRARREGLTRVLRDYRVVQARSRQLQFVGM